MSTPISGRYTAVTVEYDSRGLRERKTFVDPFAARRFYVAKLLAGRNPRVMSSVLRNPEPKRRLTMKKSTKTTKVVTKVAMKKAANRIEKDKNGVLVRTYSDEGRKARVTVLNFLVKAGATKPANGVAGASVIKGLEGKDIRAGHILWCLRDEGLALNSEVKGVRNAFYVTSTGLKLLKS